MRQIKLLVIDEKEWKHNCSFFFGHAQLGRRGNRLIELSESSQPAIDPTSMMLFMEVQSDMMN